MTSSILLRSSSYLIVTVRQTKVFWGGNYALKTSRSTLCTNHGQLQPNISRKNVIKFVFLLTGALNVMMHHTYWIEQFNVKYLINMTGMYLAFSILFARFKCYVQHGNRFYFGNGNVPGFRFYCPHNVHLLSATTSSHHPIKLVWQRGFKGF